MIPGTIERQRLNQAGQALHYGHCYICGDRWNWKRPHCIGVGTGHSAFPYCEDCHITAKKSRKLAAMARLTWLWLREAVGRQDALTSIQTGIWCAYYILRERAQEPPAMPEHKPQEDHHGT
jgi:hypothetical protein